jgi:hypothetical protein
MLRLLTGRNTEIQKPAGSSLQERSLSSTLKTEAAGYIGTPISYVPVNTASHTKDILSMFFSPLQNSINFVFHCPPISATA